MSLFQGELLANMKLLDGKNSELRNFIQQLNGNCSVIQVKLVYSRQKFVHSFLAQVPQAWRPLYQTLYMIAL